MQREKKRDLMQIMVELSRFTEHGMVTPLLLEYQHLMGLNEQNHYYCIGRMYSKYLPHNPKEEV